MKKTIDGVTYKQHKVNKGCDGCVADYGDTLCRTLNDDGGCFVSWKMVKAKGPLQVGSTLKIDGVRYVAHAEEVDGGCDGCAGDGSGPCERITDKAHEKFSNTEDGTCGEHALIWKRKADQPVEPEPEVAPFAVVAFKGETYDVVPDLSKGECDGCAFDEKPCEKVNDELERLTGKRCGGAEVIFKLREAAPPVGDGWIDWAGGECPVDPCTLVEVELRDRVKDTRLAGEYWWTHGGDHSPGGDIVRYRVVKQPEAPEAPTTQTVMVSFTFPADIDRGTVEGYVQNIVRTAVNGTPRDKDAHALLMNWDIE